ncbi:hypothetical protein F4811DRAFT_540309 [Daldinia bambusicola]|nr:hypothetical protein F4811DRAFT_540309 [Daldinia bambusicola]
MPRKSYVTRDSTSDVIHQLARVADTLHDSSLGKVDLLEEYLDHELQKRSADLNMSLEKVNTTIQSLQGNANYASGCCEGGDEMIDCLNLLQAQIQTLHADKNSLWAGVEDLKSKIAGIRSSQHDLRDVLHMMRADAQALRKPTDTFGFPQFKRLPPEVRATIWDLAIPSRILGLAKEDLGGPLYFEPYLSPPSVAHVCREARSIACRTGRLVSTMEEDWFRYSTYNGRGGRRDVVRQDDVTSTAELSWYDPSRDFLRLHLEQLKGPLDATIVNVTTCTQFVIGGLDSRHTHCHRLLSYLSDTQYFPRLKVVDFISDSYEHWPHSDHILDTQLFFGPDRQRFLSLNIDDKLAKKALVDRIKRSRSVKANWLVSWLEKDNNNSWGDNDRSDPISKMKWPQFLDHLQKKWISLKSQPDYSDEANYTKQADESSKEHRLSESQKVSLSRRCPVFGRVKLIKQARPHPEDVVNFVYSPRW